VPVNTLLHTLVRIGTQLLSNTGFTAAKKNCKILYMAKRVDKLLTNSTAPVATDLAKQASLKLVLSAGILCLADQTAEQRELYLKLASDKPSWQVLARERKRQLEKIKTELLANRNFSPAQSKKLKEMFAYLQDLYARETSEKSSAGDEPK